MPCLIAKPLRGLTCASYSTGSSIKRPVGTKALSIGSSCKGSPKKALMSIPAAPSVAYCGNGLLDVLITFIFNGCIISKISGYYAKPVKWLAIKQ
jgi:hypothetical protein